MTHTRPLRQVIADLRTLTDELELLLEGSEPATEPAEWPVFDPEINEPEVTPKFRGIQSVEDDWCGLVLWASLRAINVRQNRGATKDEVVRIAKSAGYRDGRGWNRWTGWEERGDGRWVTDLSHMRHYYSRVHRQVPEDLA